MRKLLSLALPLALVLCLSVRAEDTKSAMDKLVGTWVSVKGSETMPPGSTMEVTKDGKLKLVFKMGDKSLNVDGTMKLNDAKSFKATLKQGDKENTETVKIEKLTDKELVIVDEQGKKDIFEKKK